MARRYRRRYRKRAPYSVRMTNFSGSQSASAQNQFVIWQQLAKNPNQATSTVSNKYKVKNFDVGLNITSEVTTEVQNLQAFIMFLPQGYGTTSSELINLPYDHPEWILNHRFLGCPFRQTVFAPAYKIKTRLSRNLDTGDAIILLILGTNPESTSITLNYNGLVKYVSKAN